MKEHEEEHEAERGTWTVRRTRRRTEILVTRDATDYEGLVVFRKSYGGSVVVGSDGAEPRIFTGNRGYDAEIYEVVILAARLRVGPDSSSGA